MKIKTFLQPVLAVVVSVFAVAGVVGATTIGNDITTGGSLTVTGTSTLGLINAGVWQGSDIDISDYTNLAVANNLALTGDTVGVAAGYAIPATSSIANWNTAYGWGNHALQGYLTFAEIATNTDLAVTDNLSLKGAGETIGVAAGYEIPLTASTTEWADAFGWGDHALFNYLTTVDISANTNLAVANNLNLTGDTVGVAAGYEIPLTASTTEWADAFGWGDHSLAGYLTTVDISANTNLAVANNLNLTGDTVGVAAGYEIPLTASTTEWADAFGWGNHAGLYDLIGVATTTITNHEATYNHANYDTAYGWGDHSFANYLFATSTTDLFMNGFEIFGVATTSTGNLVVANDASIGGNLFASTLGVAGDAITGDLTVSSSTNATSTLTIGVAGSSVACLKLAATDGGYVWCVAKAGNISCSINSCE